MTSKKHLCQLCHKNPKYGKTAACKQCLAQLEKEGGGKGPGENICSLCGDTIPASSNVCAKCGGELAGKKTQKRQSYSNTLERIESFLLSAASDKARQGFRSVSEIAKALRMDKADVEHLLKSSSLKKKVESGHKYGYKKDHFRIKKAPMKDDLNHVVNAILVGEPIVPQIERLLR